MTCQTTFSFNFNRFVGRTDGEAPEHGWAQINPVATSTAEMGPGHRRDMLDDHFGDGNWRKTTTMGELWSCKLKSVVRLNFFYSCITAAQDQGSCCRMQRSQISASPVHFRFTRKFSERMGT
jgi:hypothetical protein